MNRDDLEEMAAKAEETDQLIKDMELLKKYNELLRRSNELLQWEVNERRKPFWKRWKTPAPEWKSI